MKIDIPYELKDPVIVIVAGTSLNGLSVIFGNGPWTCAIKRFEYSDISAALQNRVFYDVREAVAECQKLNAKGCQ